MTPHRKRKRGHGQGRKTKTASLPCNQVQNITEYSPHVSWPRCGVPFTSSHVLAYIPKTQPDREKSTDRPKGGSFHRKIPDQPSSKRPCKTRKEHETVITKRRVGDVMTTRGVGSWRGPRDRERSFVGNLGTSKCSL